MNEILTVLKNKIPVKIGPWQFNSKFTEYSTARELYSCLPEDVELAEAYVFDYSKGIKAGRLDCFILQLFYSNDTKLSEIKTITAQFKQPKERFLEVVYSDAVSPLHIGNLTGSVTMVKSELLKTTIITEHNLGLEYLPSFFSKYFQIPVTFLLLQNLIYLKRWFRLIRSDREVKSGNYPFDDFSIKGPLLTWVGLFNVP